MAVRTDNSPRPPLCFPVSCSHLPSLWGPRQAWQRQGRGLSVCVGYGCGPHPPARPDPKPGAEPSPATFFQLSSHHLQEAFRDRRSQGACALSARQTRAHARPIQTGLPSWPWEPPPTLLVTWTPGPRAGSMGQGAAAEPKSRCRQGTLGVNGKRPLPPQPGQEAQSHGGGGGRLPPGRPQGCGVGVGWGDRAPRAQHQRWGLEHEGRGTRLWVRA